MFHVWLSLTRSRRTGDRKITARQALTSPPTSNFESLYRSSCSFQPCAGDTEEQSDPKLDHSPSRISRWRSGFCNGMGSEHVHKSSLLTAYMQTPARSFPQSPTQLCPIVESDLNMIYHISLVLFGHSKVSYEFNGFRPSHWSTSTHGDPGIGSGKVPLATIKRAQRLDSG